MEELTAYEKQQAAIDLDDSLPMGLDPALSEQLCPRCHSACLDLGKESADEYTRAKQWYLCSASGCNYRFQIIIGPTKIQRPGCDLGAWKRNQIKQKPRKH